MPLICRNCHNKTDFYRYNQTREYHTEPKNIDQDYENVGYGDNDCDESETTQTGTPVCSNCSNGGRVIEVSQTEWERWEGPDAQPKTWKEKYRGK